MPYLKIKTSNEPGKEWTTINNLNLDTITIEEKGTLINKGTISGGTITESTISGGTISGGTISGGTIAKDTTLTNNGTISGGTITSSNSDKKKNITITDGSLTINGISLDNYLETSTSACKVWDNTSANEDDPPGSFTKKAGNLLIEKKKINNTTYHLLWYCDGSDWIRINAIWG